MRRRVTALAMGLAGLGVACNGILGIGAPTLVEKDGGASDGNAGHDATRDGQSADARSDVTRGDARGDGTTGKDATTDGPAHDASTDAGDGGSPSDATAFDGNCSCSGDACAPVILAHVQLGISSIATAPSGVCYYASNVLMSPFPAFIGCVGWGGKLTIIDDTSQDPANLATRGGEIYWIRPGALEECSIASCTATSIASGGFFEGQLALGPSEIYWNQSDGIHACTLTGGCDGGAPIPQTSATGVLAANGSGLFWVNSSNSLLQFCPTAGCPDGGTVVNVDGGANEVVASDTDLYWFAATGDIVTCPLAGGACQSAPRVLVPETASLNVRRFVVDSTGLYWTNEVTNAIERVRLDGGSVATLAHTSASSFTSAQLALGQSCLFWGDTEGDAGVLYAGAK